jgi:hypothetical protein
MAAATCLITSITAPAGTATYDFSTDPHTDLAIGGNSVNPMEWVQEGGNPGGFLAVTWPIGNQVTTVVFPDIDPGRIVTAFNFKCDLRVGNSTGDRAADGFSISFARADDPVLLEENAGNQGVFAGGIAEGGATTGIAVSFDTWSGNVLPDGGDIEGIIVRVDNRTVLRQSLPTRHGACDDITSLQTGPRDAQYWTDNGTDPSVVTVPEAWETLCWQPFEVNLDEDGTLDVIWKGNRVLDNFQTDYFPSAGRLVFAGRTGGANEHTHVDNLVLTTTAADVSGGPPPAVTALTAAEQGARRVLLTWTAPNYPSRIAYEIERNGTVLPGLATEPQFEDLGLNPGTAYNYIVRAVNLAGERGADATVSATTVAEVPGVGFPLARVYRTSTDGAAFGGATQFDIDTVLADPKWPDSPDSSFYINGLSFGEPAFGNTYGDNLMVAVSGVLNVPENGQYRFFVRSDDASRFYLNTTGAAVPDPLTATHIANEDGCCGPFEEVGAGDNGDGTFPTSEPVNLTAGTDYGYLFLVKEGGGGDWGQVAMRLEGDDTAATQLQAISGALLESPGDPVGASVTITTQPANATAAAYKTATFNVAADTASPYTATVVYQWYKNDALIAGATAASYTVPVVQPGDNGARYKALVAVPGASATSSEATLTVTADVAPTVAEVTGSDSFTEASITFDQPVAAPSATTAANYTGSGGLTVTAAELVDEFTVLLTTSQQTPGTTYTITIANVQNLGGTPVAAGTTADLVAWSLQPNRARADQFTGFTGAADADIDTVLGDAKWPNNPDVVRYTDGLIFGPALGDTWGDNHLVAMKAILRPTQTGQVTFHIRSDDASRLYINTSGSAIPDPASSPIIAIETDCCDGFVEPGTFNDDGSTSPTSEPVNLTAGQDYGILYLVKEGGGGDWGQVAWRPVGDTTPAGNLQPITAQSYWYGPAGGSTGDLEIESIALTGGNVVITYAAGTLESAASVTGPYAPVAGATSPYSTPPSGAATFYRLSE